MPTSSIDWAAVRAAAAFRLAMPRTPIGGRIGERLGVRHRQLAGIPGLSSVRAGRRPPPRRLGGLRAFRAARRPSLSRGGRAAHRPGARHQPVDGGDRGEAARLRRARRRCWRARARPRSPTRASSRRRPAEPQPLARARRHRARLSPATTTLSALEEAHLPFRRRSLRVVVSDFLFPHDPTRWSRGSRATARRWRSFSSRCARKPSRRCEGGRRLVDVEGRGELDLVIDERAVRDYRARFGRLRLGLSAAARRAGARFAHVVAGTPVRDVARALAAAGVLEAA